MGKYDQPSRCSSGAPIHFRWYGFPTCADGTDLDTATDKFLGLLTARPRIPDRYVVGIARSEFRLRMTLAMQGKLEPVEEVKSVDSSNPPPLYEIRWQGITFQETLQNGQIVDKKAAFRLYHSEPVSIPNIFVGHHIHEKLIGTEQETRDWQNAEIATAKGFYDAGFKTSWGIPVAP